jgi:hypothetical protein
VTEVVTNDSDTDVSLITTTHVNRGKWVLNVEDFTEGEPVDPIGQAALTFSHMDANSDYELVANGVDGAHTNSIQPTASIDLLVNPSLLYVVRTNTTTGAQTFNIFPSITTSTNGPIDLALVTNSLIEETVTIPDGYSGLYLSVFGVRKTGTVVEKYKIYKSHVDEGTFTFSRPGATNGFQAYYSQSEMNSDEYNSTTLANKPFDITPLAATLNASLANGKFTVAALGTMDAYHIELDQPNVFWTFVAAKTTLSITIPEIPTILKNLVSIDRSKASISITAMDYADFNGYDGFISYIRASNNGYADLDASTIEAKFLTKELDYSGGRKANGKSRKK